MQDDSGDIRRRSGIQPIGILPKGPEQVGPESESSEGDSRLMMENRRKIRAMKSGSSDKKYK